MLSRTRFIVALLGALVGCASVLLPSAMADPIGLPECDEGQTNRDCCKKKYSMRAECLTCCYNTFGVNSSDCNGYCPSQ